MERIMKIATVTGFIGQDPTIKVVGDKQTKLASFTVGSSGYAGKGRGDDGGDYETTWFRIQVWGQQADYVEKSFNKGDTVEVVGDITHSKWVKDDGTEQRNLDIKASHVKVLKKKNADVSKTAVVDTSDIPF